MSRLRRVLVLVGTLLLFACDRQAVTSSERGAQSNEAERAATVARIELRGASGGPGDFVDIGAILHDGGGKIVATSTDIEIDRSTLELARTAALKPLCRINPALRGKESEKEIAVGIVGETVNMTKIRVGVLGYNQKPLPDGWLFTCRFMVAEEATAPTGVLRNVSHATNAEAREVEVRGEDGVVSIQLPTAKPSDPLV